MVSKQFGVDLLIAINYANLAMKMLLNLIWDRNADGDYLIYNLFKNPNPTYTDKDIKVANKLSISNSVASE